MSSSREIVSQRLAVYGTLRPGEVHHHLVAHLPGEWRSGWVRGRFHAQGWGLTHGFPALVPDPETAPRSPRRRAWSRGASPSVVTTTVRSPASGAPGSREPLPDLRPTAPLRELVLFEGKNQHGRLKALLGTLREGAKTWHDPVTEDPLLGATEAWDLFNATGDKHPIHVHLVQFRVVGHRRFAGEASESGVLGEIRWIEEDRPPGPTSAV